MSEQYTFVAMSGGVDSSVAALLLQEAGQRLAGVNLRLIHNEDLGEPADKTCCSLSDAEDAALVARRLGFPFYVFDFSTIFRETVMADFIAEYRQGRTPNPCAVCNRRVKFGALLDRVLTLGATHLATGHYAQVARDPDTGRYLLKRGADRRKDQSYFLYMLTQHQLSHILFPLGAMDKGQVRQLAQDHGLVNAKKRDSQDICFVPGGDYTAFLQRNGVEFAPGDFVDQTGNVLGRHRGLERYTTGQRKGLGVSANAPLYVVRKDLAAGNVVLGPDSALYTRELTAKDMNWVSIPELTAPLRVSAKTRYSQREAGAEVFPLAGGRVQVRFDEPQRAITAGQAVVFYDGETVVGGGTICP